MQMFVCASNQIFVKVISKSLWEISQNGLSSCIDFNIIQDRGIQIRHDIKIAIVKHKNAFIINYYYYYYTFMSNIDEQKF